MSNDKSTLLEQALGRLFKHRRDSVSVREFDLKRLLEWKGVGNCRYAVEAIVSLVLEAWRPLAEQAQVWIAAQEDKRLILAVALIRAKRTPEIRAKIKALIFSHHRLTQSESIQALFFKMDDGDEVSWEEIKEAVNLGNYQILPPDNRPNLFAHCWRVMPDPCHKGETLAALQEVVSSTDLTDKSFLRQWIVESALSINSEEVFVILERHFSLFVKEIVQILSSDQTLPRTLYSGIQRHSLEDKDHIKFYGRYFRLAKLFLDCSISLSKRDKQRCIQRLLFAHSNPWIWSIADELCEQNQGSWQFVPKLLVSWLGVNASRGYQDGYSRPMGNIWPDFLWDNLSQVEMDKFHKALMHVPDKIVEKFAKRSIKQGNANQSLQAMLTGGYIMCKEPRQKCQVFLRVLADKIQSLDEVGSELIDDSGILLFLKHIGFDEGRDTLVHWLKKYTGRYRVSSYQPKPEDYELLTQHIIPNQLSVGRLLTPDNVSGLLQLGYKLLPEDLKSEDQVIRLLAGSDNPVYAKLSGSNIWDNPHWSEVIFASDFAPAWIVRSTLITAASSPDIRQERLDWLEEVLVPECCKSSKLSKALCACAWNKDPRESDHNFSTSSRLARLVLIKDGRWQKWLEEGERTVLIQSYCQRNWSWLLSHEKEIAQVILTQEKQLDLFFRGISEVIPDSDILYGGQMGIAREQPSLYTNLFEGADARKRLAGWLLSHRNQIDPENWLNWIKELNLIQIDDRVKKIVSNSLNNRGKEADLALEILKITA